MPLWAGPQLGYHVSVPGVTVMVALGVIWVLLVALDRWIDR